MAAENPELKSSPEKVLIAELEAKNQEIASLKNKLGVVEQNLRRVLSEEANKIVIATGQNWEEAYKEAERRLLGE